MLLDVWGKFWGARRSAIKSLQEPLLVDKAGFVWALGSLCALNRIPFDAELLLRQYPPPYSHETLIKAAAGLGLHGCQFDVPASRFDELVFPCLVWLNIPNSVDTAEVAQTATLALLTSASQEKVTLFPVGTNVAQEWSAAEFARHYLGKVFLVAKSAEALTDPDAMEAKQGFGFSWFLPELLKYKSLWRDIILASLVIQMLALGTPLFTQTIIDKVVVHRTESTLFVVAVGMFIFMTFSTTLGWIRQYLVLHTGNRVDATLAATVFEHLFRLPPRYFEHRPTGVIAARLQGVETIREFIASAAVSLVLDLPFMLIFLAVMFWYSVPLTLIALAVLAVIAIISAAIAPVFQKQLNEQFLMGARNQAFITEYVGGVETVKSLQMEPQIQQRFAGYLAQYLGATFRTRQLANTYNTVTGALEQFMTLSILVAGAWIVMRSAEFTIGMLVAFQMFSGRLSQPVMRIVGLWQQFQQASLSVKRLGDIMNAPTEPYSLVPSRVRGGNGQIDIDELGFRHHEKLPFLYRGFNLSIRPGSMVAIMGPSGSGKSTLAKLLQGFYQPVDGRIRIDGTDIQNLSANELRSHFGVVPQDTVLFSGTLYENLMAGNPHAGFEEIVQACRMAEIHDVIERLPDGYQTVVGERGVGLSGGQRQRVAIARALLKRPRVLIFDEATSGLDSLTAEHFAVTVNQLRGKATLIFITHALPKALHVDQVVRIGSEQPLVVSEEHGSKAQPA